MNRTKSRVLWQRIADGDLEREQYDEVDLLAWIRAVAAGLLDADGVPAGLRPGEIVRAVGLDGALDPNAKLREQVELLESFPLIGKDGQAREPAHGERMRTLIRAARDAGLIGEDVSDPEARKRIERLLGQG